MPKLILKQCECKRSFNPKDFGASDNLCPTCNQKVKSEIRKKDAIRKSLNRDDSISSNLERLAGVEDV